MNEMTAVPGKEVSIIGKLILTGALALLVACETPPQKPDPSPPTAAEVQAVIDQIVLNSANTNIVNPFIIVRFDSNNCPVSASFRAKIPNGAGGEVPITLPTGVPIKSGSSVTWIALSDSTGQQIAVPYAVFFHPFRRPPFLSDDFGIVGPEQLRAKVRLPEGVDYKYSIVTLDDSVDPPIVDTNCDALDPMIRILK